MDKKEIFKVLWQNSKAINIAGAVVRVIVAPKFDNVAEEILLLNKANVKRRGCGCRSGYDENGNIECCSKCYIYLGAM